VKAARKNTRKKWSKGKKGRERTRFDLTHFIFRVLAAMQTGNIACREFKSNDHLQEWLDISSITGWKLLSYRTGNARRC